jgi:hypothetical protein
MRLVLQFGVENENITRSAAPMARNVSVECNFVMFLFR